MGERLTHHIGGKKKNQREKQSWFHRTANIAAASRVKFIFNAHQKAPAAFPFTSRALLLITLLITVCCC